MTPPKGARGERKREQLRQAAYRCFRDSGYHDTTVDAICQRAGSSKGSFYWHYGSKQEVFIDILETWTRQIMDEIDEQFERSVHEDDYISAVTGALENELRRGRVIIPLWMEFTMMARREKEVQLALAKFYRRARLAIAEILRPFWGDKLTESELRGVSATIFGAYTGLVMQELSDPEQADAHEVIERVMNTLGWWFHKLREAHELTGRPMNHRREPQGDPEGEGGVVLAKQGQRLDEAEVADFLSGFEPLVVEQTEALRSLVHQHAGDLDERIISGWRVIAYQTDRLVCYIKPRPEALHFGFYQGARLEDPGGVLQGAGRRQRHMVLSLEAPLPAEQIESFLRACRAL